MRVVITGAQGAVARHVVDRMTAHPEVVEVIAIDREPGDGVERFDLLTDDFEHVLKPDDRVVHLASTSLHPARDAASAQADRAMAERLIEGCAAVGVSQLLISSSAMVYGAWPDNPQPLTESAPIRPNPEFRFAMVRAEIEQMANRRAASEPFVLSIVRPATTLARGRENRLAIMLRRSAAFKTSEGDAPGQFLHAEDLASAIEVIITGAHAGTFNVAPDGWLTPADVVALQGSPQSPLRVPGVVVSGLSTVRRQMGAQTHPGLTPYLQHSWVLANDRLRSLGWQPQFSNEEAYIAGHTPSRFDGIDAKRRQELALGVTGAALASAAVGIASAVSWVVRRQR